MTASARGASRPETTRMFESDFLERFSRIHPATPFVVWIPVVGVLLCRSAFIRHDIGFFAMLGVVVSGFLFWTLAEYILHRWIFHWTNDTPWGKRIHFLLHGVHHEFPNDKDRLVMPLLTSVPLAVIFYSLYTFVMGARLGEPFMAGFIVGYLGYDGTHYAIHHFKPTTRLAKWIRRHHMLHHHNDHEGGFGVSSPLWDFIFRTMPKTKREKAAAG